MAAKAIAFINFKGGVGKTAATVNIGASLAFFRQKRVLIVDLDAQCNASFWLMHPQQWKEHIGSNAHRSTYRLLADHIESKDLFDFEKAVLHGVPRAEASMIASLDLLPAAVDLIKVEDIIHQGRHPRSFEYLAKTLKPHYKDYDYIFFDCPPNTYSVTKNALFAADYCVVPYLPDFLSLSGFQIFARLVDEFNEKVATFKNVKHKTSIAAVLVSHYRLGLRDHEKNVGDLGLILAHLKNEGLVHPKAAILEPYVRFNVKVAESTNAHLPVTIYDTSSIGAEDYYKLAEAFDEHFSKLP